MKGSWTFKRLKSNVEEEKQGLVGEMNYCCQHVVLLRKTVLGNGIKPKVASMLLVEKLESTGIFYVQFSMLKV